MAHDILGHLFKNLTFYLYSNICLSNNIDNNQEKKESLQFINSY